MASPPSSSKIPFSVRDLKSDVADASTHNGGGVLVVYKPDNTAPRQLLWIDAATDSDTVADWAAANGYPFYDFIPYSSHIQWGADYPAHKLVWTLPGIDLADSPLHSSPTAPSPAPVHVNPTTVPLQTPRRPSTAPGPSPQATSTSASTVDPQLLQTLLAAFTATLQSNPKKPTTAIPVWDGQASTAASFLQMIENYKTDPFYNGVTDWTQELPAYAAESSHLATVLYPTINSKHRGNFTNNKKYISAHGHGQNGILMLHDYINLLRPTNSMNQMQTVIELSTLEMGPSENGSDYAARARGLEAQASGLSISSLVYLFALKGLPPDQYEGIFQRYYQNDPAVVKGTVQTLSDLITAEDQLRSIAASGSSPPAANRASDSSTRRRNQPKDDTESPPPQQPPPPAYPPDKPPHHSLVNQLFKDKKKCPICHHPITRHEEFGGCPTAAQHGKVLIDDKEAADKIVAKFNAFVEERRGKRSKKSSTPNASGRRAVSSERATHHNSSGGATPPTAAAAAAVPPPASSSPSCPSSSNFYVDLEEVPSDTDDEAEFLSSHDVENWHTVGEDSRSKSKSSTSGYSDVSSSLLNPSAKQASSVRSYSSAVLFGTPSARTGSSYNSSFQSTVVSAFQSFLKTTPTQVQHLQVDDDLACADSGATDFMFPDRKAFLSYHPCSPGRVCDLAGDQSVPIVGVGSAVIRLNGKVILVRNALHIPALRNPLYSLRRHRKMPGCGVFSFCGEGSFLVFPDFILSVDDSVDNLVSYEPLGSSYKGQYDYVEPRRLLSARPASSPSADNSAASSPPDVIPPDDVSTASCSTETTSSNVSLGSSPADSSSTSADSSIDDEPPSPSDPPTVPSDDDSPQQASLPLPPSIFKSLHHDPSNLPSIPPSSVAAPCEHRTEFDPLKLHRIFGCKQYRHQQHITAASSNASLLSTGPRPTTIGDYTTIPRPPKGKPLRKRRKYLDKCHMDIVFGDSVGLHGFRYALLIVDVATRYCWIYGLTSLTGTAIVDALIKFQVEAGSLPRRFHTDFDKKLIGGKALRYILSNKSNIIAAPAGRQSSNGLVERTWRTIIEMGRAYMSEKQMSRDYWFFAIRQAVLMLNQTPGRLGRKITTPYELVHGVKPDSRTWFELFSIGFFAHDTDLATNEARTTSQAQTIAGIAVGRDASTNTITFYNPITRKYYRPPSFKLDESLLPITMFPKHIHYDGGLTCGRLRHNTDPTPEPFPPGTRVTITRDGVPSKGTIQNVPLFNTSIVSSSSSDDSSTSESSSPSTSYVVHLDDGTSAEVTYEDLISSMPEHSSTPAVDPPTTAFDGLPSFLQQDSKITIDHNGAFHRGYLHYSPQGGFAFVHRKTSRSKRIEWTVPLPDLRQNWPTLLGDDTIIPGHGQISSFLQPNSSNNAPSANFVSAKNLLSPCPPSLKQALHPNNPDREVWLKSYQEEAQGLLEHDVYERISKKDYLALRRSGAIPKAIPSMCVLVVKPDKEGRPHRAKSRIVVLGNHEDRLYSKSDHPSAAPTSITLPAQRQMIHIGVYVDDFVFYSTNDAEEELFRQVLQSRVTVDFMGDVDYFLGSAFLWQRHSNGHVSVHLSQSAFTEHTAHRFGLDRFKRVPNMTPYRSGLPIDSLPPPAPNDPDLKRRTKVYQGIVGSINWLAQCTRPDVSPALTFLASYSNAPSARHYQAAVHVLKYLYSTSDYGISYHSDACNTIQAFNHFPHHHDKEAYTDATPPSPSEVMQLTSFADACWGAQFGNALPPGTPIELFKFRSLSGYVICRSGGPVAWRALRQEQTAQSSCEAEIYATNECVKDTIALKLIAEDLHMSDGSQCTQVYNDNEACVAWSASVTNKGTKHLNLRENRVREAHLFQEVNVRHIPGQINPSDLFTKEIKDASHFRRLRDCQMVSRANFLKYGHTVPAHISTESLPYYSLSASVPAHDAFP
ncbi:hypothetical protein ACHAWC_010958 [Mediolabrus comicus]